ncbi:MAG: aspartate kinase [Opitutales bacterium]|nr:aspartate kinase [Opitutales bacterium]
MALIVQKYGGTSVKDLDRIRAVADRIAASHRAGDQVVVVVSARGGVTNRLIADAKALHPEPDDRELDVLLSIGEQETIALATIALHALGVPAVSRTGGQAGIFTDSVHTKARITEIRGGDVREQLEAGKVVIVAGFQGVDGHGFTTTLGRGGSDLSAIALAAALKADLCQIYTDVDGVYTADPRIVPDAKKIPEIIYEEMLELASLGSKVMQSRAVEFANKYNVPFEVRSSFNNNPGTIVKAETSTLEDVLVRGVACDKNQTKVVVSDIPDQPGAAAKVFRSLAEAKVNVDMIVQNVGRQGIANLTFTVPADDAYRADRAVNECLAKLGAGSVSRTDRIAKVSIVGVGMQSHSGVASLMFSTLAEHGINIQMISTSEIKISVAISLDQADDAVRVLHSAFELNK